MCMKIFRCFISVFSVFLALTSNLASARSIKSPHTDADYFARFGVNERADLKVLLASDTVSTAEKDALKFLYTYMSLSDAADYTPEFFIENIRSSLRAASELPWGDIVPDREFRHFVLPVRVNNENLDMSRPFMFEELKERVKGLSMEDAILEVNHWCHEKVTYQPSDGRTNSPFASMRSALGRCGEESTFTVAALRSVGIPARQIYTPRWAHTDDNHAWVEAWANGKWYFLGACEPEPVLDLGWFNSPASRGLLMSTNVFGRYDGPEEVLNVLPTNTTINVTGNYAPVEVINVSVVDAAGTPVEGAIVNFSIYNYAEFYPAVSRKTDKSGRASLLAGKGDMICWATDGNRFGLAVVSAKTPDNLVVLDKDASFAGSMEFDIVPPPTANSLPKLTSEQIELNDRRKATEDSIRMAYVATFYNANKSARLAAELGLDSARVEKVMTGARGNHAVIEKFLRNAPAELRRRALTLLEAVNVKDLNDVTVDVLNDHLSTQGDENAALFASYVLNPRVSVEMLTPYKRFFSSHFTSEQQKQFTASPADWVKWINDSITLESQWNPLNYCMSPTAVWNERRADARSRDIFFVAGARSLGVPARIDAVTGKTQYANTDGKWVDVSFGESHGEQITPAGYVGVKRSGDGGRVEPKYYSQFSFCKISDGLPRQLEFDEEATLSDIAATPVAMDEGQYMLLTGRRMADGGVLARAEFFVVKPDVTTEVPFEVRSAENGVSVIGGFNSENIYHDLSFGADKSLLSTTDRGYYVLGIVAPGHEPSAHALNDISAVAKEFEKWGKKIVVLLPDADAAARFDASLYPNLPTNVVMGTDVDGVIAAELFKNLNLPGREMPLFIVADTFNRVVYVQQGYTIGLGEKLLEVINQLAE